MFIWNLRDQQKKKTRQSGKEKIPNSVSVQKINFILLLLLLSSCWIVAALYALVKPQRRRKSTRKTIIKNIYIEWSWDFTGVPTIGFKNLILHSWAAICIRFMKSKKSAHKKSTAQQSIWLDVQIEMNDFSVFSAPFLFFLLLCYFVVVDASCQRRKETIFVWRHNCDINSDTMLP